MLSGVMLSALAPLGEIKYQHVYITNLFYLIYEKCSWPEENKFNTEQIKFDQMKLYTKNN